MTYTILISDSLLFGILLYLSFRILKLLLIVRANSEVCRPGSESFCHLVEHLWAATIAFIGATSATVLKAVDTLNANNSSVLLNTSYSIICVAGIILVNHMIKEETPGHPFYHSRQTKGRRTTDA